MTNPETRKARQAAAAQKLQNQANVNNGRNELVVDEMECITPTWNVAHQRRDVAAQECTDDEDSITPTPDSDDLDEEGELSLDTCSSFSLQECIDEFKARRMRRISTHSRDAVTEKDAAHKLDPAEEDLINQNRCNKEQERKCKPCKNGFCYCFTSDSGDAMGDGVERPGAHVRQNRRSRKSESSQVSNAQQHGKLPQPKERRRQSAPAGLKCSPNSPKKAVTKPSIAPVSTSKDQITAISRLETSSRNAPLIHIIQELHNNCVISEVRVNKHKIQAQRSRSLSSKPSPKKTHFILPETKTETTKLPTRSPRKSLPSAPPLDKISELDSLSERFVYSTSLNSSAKSNDSPGRRHKAAGLLLQKRLSQTNTQYKPRNLNEPPPKPPRCSFNSAEDKTSISTLASTTPSLREAERVLDDFLRSKGVALPGANAETQRRQSKERKERANEKAKKQQQQQQDHQKSKVASNKEKRKSYPLIQPKPKTQLRKPLPSCPSLSDIERMVDDTKKPSTNYDKNIRHFAEKPIKEHSFGWKEREPDIHQMLNYDSNANRRKFRSQAVQAEPQTIGWHIPPKMTLDTVDGEVHSNLAVNISKKVTPVKTPIPLNAAQKADETQKFILSEQLKSFVQSPWSNKSNKNNDTTTKKPKSSLKSSSRNFLNNSKKRILRLVSPKKDNREPRSEPFVARRTPLRSIGIQTSREELRSYETSSTPQSPPGSYFSAVQTSQQSSSTPTQDTQEQPADNQHFDFNRKVHSPPKRPKPAIHRKLNFPLPRNSAADGGRVNDEQSVGGGDATMTKTYRSFHSELDQDVLSKMGYILSNIRAKLEASDDHAMRTFQEIERREQQIAEGFDYPDSAPPQMRHQTRVDLHRNNRNFAIVQTEHDPIYSEIEEDSMLISSSPQFESKTGIEHFPAARDPNALYAKVTKRPCKPSRAAKKSAPAAERHLPSPSTSLAQCMRDSLKSKITLKPLPPLPATPKHGVVSTFSASSDAPHSQSLNNIRVMEHNSPPKRHRHLSKSDLSLQRSEIFLENLCRSEIIINAASLEPLEKVQNSQLDESSYISINSCDLPTQLNSPTRTVEEKDEDDEVSYELPHDAEQDDVCQAAAGSQLGLSHFDPPHSTNQSTPKKSHTKTQTFTTKPATLQADARQQLNLDISIDDCLPSTHQSSSCPNTPHRLPKKPVDVLDNECSTSLIEVTATSRADRTQPNNNKSALARYQQLKNVLRKSLRKSKKFVKTETKRLSSSLSFPTAPTSIASINKLHQSEIQQCEELLTSSSLNLDSLFSLDGTAEDQPLQHQLAKAVCICRQLPDLEISPEMVEAERLLLFSTLRRGATKAKGANCRQSQKQKRFYVDAMRLPIRTDASQDLFFNYFYIGTFYCDGVIRSTQSVECRNYEAIFSDCGIEFACSDEAEVKCEIFMLRLRKVSTISLEPTKKSIMNLLTTSRSSVGSSCDDIVSRFRLHGSFTITSQNFVPYEYVESASKSSNSLCLRSSTSCKIAITPRTQSTNLATDMLLTGRAEVRFPKCTHSGFLNVQQPQNKHHWNRRWCILDGLFVRVWQDVPLGSELSESELPPLMEFDLRLRIATGPLECASEEQCARPRSFALDCCVTPAVDDAHAADSAAIFFVADTQNELNEWLLVLNKVVDFMNQWMK